MRLFVMLVFLCWKVDLAAGQTTSVQNKDSPGLIQIHEKKYWHNRQAIDEKTLIEKLWKEGHLSEQHYQQIYNQKIAGLGLFIPGVLLTTYGLTQYLFGVSRTDQEWGFIWATIGTGMSLFGSWLYNVGRDSKMKKAIEKYNQQQSLPQPDRPLQEGAWYWQPFLQVKGNYHLSGLHLTTVF